jgi:hypothetical protein
MYIELGLEQLVSRIVELYRTVNSMAPGIRAEKFYIKVLMLRSR